MEARKQLREWRRRQPSISLPEGKGLTQTEAAAKLGVTKNFIGFLERGEQKPGLSFANTAKRVCGIPTEAWEIRARGRSARG